MKQHGDYIIAEAGCYLSTGREKGLKMPVGKDYVEKTIDIKNITIVDNLIFVDNLIVIKDDSYPKMKKSLINGIYSNDDQIAIILNGDSEMMQLMQDWREWFSNLLHSIRN